MAPGKALGDWQVTGVVSAISGTPIDFTANAANLRAPGNRQTPNVSGTPDVLGGIGSGNLWFDTSVFSAPAREHVGQRRSARSPDRSGVYNLDASIVKIIRVGTKRAEIRADFFNALNISHYANPERHARQRELRAYHRHPAQTERTIRFGARFLF